MDTTGRSATRRHVRLALTSGFVAVSAIAGAVAMAVGILDMGATVNDRLPFHSPQAGALALAIVVGAPMAVASFLAATGRDGAPEAAIAAGALLVGWIGVQVVVIRTFSWLQPAMAAAGVVVLLAGWLARRNRSER